MPGQVWSVDVSGGFLYVDELSDTLRAALQPLTKFRQLNDAADATEKGLRRGDKYHWDTVDDVTTQGRDLLENVPIPETSFTIGQNTLTITEAGNSVPYTGKLELLSKFWISDVIDKALKNDARKFFDIKSYLQFDATPLRVAPTSGTSTTAVTLTTNSATATTNNVALGADHIKAISDIMQERNIPPFIADDYCAISHPTTWRTFKNDLETIEQFTPGGFERIVSGIIGRYEGFRFITQNSIPKGGANDTTTFDAYTRTADAWNNGLSSWAFFFGGDTVMEAICVPEEIRAKRPQDYGRQGGIAWYYLGGFGNVHTDATNARIIKWDSAA